MVHLNPFFLNVQKKSCSQTPLINYSGPAPDFRILEAGIWIHIGFKWVPIGFLIGKPIVNSGSLLISQPMEPGPQPIPGIWSRASAKKFLWAFSKVLVARQREKNFRGIFTLLYGFHKVSYGFV